MLRSIIALFLLSIIIIGCCATVHPNKSNWVLSADKQTQLYHLKYSIDETFSEKEKAEIVKAVNMWEWSLNGQCQFERIKDWNWDNDITKDAINGQVMLFLNVVEPDNYMIENPHILAYVNAVGGKIVKINSPRIYSYEKIIGPIYKTVVLHEIGHVVGLGHNDNKYSLMHPYITRLTKFCVDNETAGHLKESDASWNIANMNICVIQPNQPTAE